MVAEASADETVVEEEVVAEASADETVVEEEVAKNAADEQEEEAN